MCCCWQANSWGAPTNDPLCCVYQAKKTQPEISQWLSEERKLNLGLLMCCYTARMFFQQTLQTQQLGSKVRSQEFKQKLQSWERTQTSGDAKPKRSKTNLNWNILQTIRVFCQLYVSSALAVGSQFCAMQTDENEMQCGCRGHNPPCHPRCRRSRCSLWRLCGQWRGSASPRSLLTPCPR